MAKEKDLCLPFDIEATAANVIEKLENGVRWRGLSEEERLTVVKYFRDQGKYTVDEIAAKLKVSHMTVHNYTNKLKKAKAQELSSINIWELGADLWEKYQAAFRLAMKERKPQAAAQVLTHMLNAMQSMGLIYKAPTRRQIQAAIQQHISHSKENVTTYTKFKEQIKGKELAYEQILNELMAAVDEDKVIDVSNKKEARPVGEVYEGSKKCD